MGREETERNNGAKKQTGEEKDRMQQGEIHLLRGGQKLTERKEQRAERMRRRSVGSKSESETARKKEEKQLKERKQRDAETDRRRRGKKTEFHIFW